ncbi:hypothetical protein [Cryptosporangium minutisporangium]|uniref:Uncharacterized protein n=1 Tax=Cryptosporangium minutisporangium TaxID=113569 RepID=A0ABP6SZL7_9ACTN
MSGDGDLGTPFPIADLAAASFAVSGLSVASLLEASGLDAPAVAVDRPESVAWFDVPMAPTRYIHEPEQHGIHSRWMAEYLTADDRWVRVQATPARNIGDTPARVSRCVGAGERMGRLGRHTASRMPLSSRETPIGRAATTG